MTNEVVKTSIRNLPDNARFKLTAKSRVYYRLQSLDHKKRMAIYTSESSKRTFKKGWGKEVYV